VNKRWFLAAKIISFAAFLAFLALIIYGVTARDFSAEGSVLLSIFWGQFTMLDIYAAFLVIFIWVVIREQSFLRSALWFILIMLGGSMSICLYVFLALMASDNNVQKLLLGRRV